MDIKSLLSKMTLEEKLGQMTQLNANCLYGASEGGVTGPASRLNLSAEQISSVGSTLNFVGASEMKLVQKEHLSQDRLGIPLLFMHDVIHGYRTIYPIPLGMGATFNPELMERCCAVAAKEAALGGIHVTFSPMVDLVRDARWGRCMESCGEDVYLNSVMAKAQVRGYQGDFSNEYNISACVKHFAAYGAPESGRDYNSVDMSEHTLREYYLPAYRAAVDADVDMVMTSFNTIGGVPSAGNQNLVRGILRDEWGFDKIVISDYAAFTEMKVHGACADKAECAELALNATNDIEMMSTCYMKNVKKLLAAGKITMDDIDRAVMRVLELKEKLGLFDNPYRAADEEKEAEVCLSPEHRAVAKEAAIESAVLLKNDGVLPFGDDIKRVAVIGPFANIGMIGFWSCHGKEEEAVSAVGGFGAALGSDNVFYTEGCSGELLAEPDEEKLARAVELAEKCDAVVLCLGEARGMSGEGNSRADISLSEAQCRLIKSVTAVNPKSVVVLYSGRPLALGNIASSCPAIIEMWQPGTEGGSALAELVYGKSDFVGRLPMSFPYHVGQAPIYYSRLNTGRPKPDDSRAYGYVSQYLDYPNRPLYPFGYGLSYTAFELGEPELSSDEMERGGKITVSVKVKNTGARSGQANVQLYIRDVVSLPVRPVKEMKNFERVMLSPGEERLVSFTISEAELAYHTMTGEYKAESGEFYVFTGLSSAEERHASFMLK